MTVELKQAMGLRLKRARESAGLTQEQLAEIVERTKDAISSIERGINFPAVETLQRICSATNTTMSRVLDDGDRSAKYISLKSDIDHIMERSSEEDLDLYLSILRLIFEKNTKKKIHLK